MVSLLRWLVCSFSSGVIGSLPSNCSSAIGMVFVSVSGPWGYETSPSLSESKNNSPTHPTNTSIGIQSTLSISPIPSANIPSTHQSWSSSKPTPLTAKHPCPPSVQQLAQHCKPRSSYRWPWPPHRAFSQRLVSTLRTPWLAVGSIRRWWTSALDPYGRRDSFLLCWSLRWRRWMPHT